MRVHMIAQRPHRPGVAVALAGRRRRGARDRRLDGRPLRRVPRVRLHPRRGLALRARSSGCAPTSSPASARLIERGQWHVTGGQFIQPDLNLPTAAGLHRQIEHGQRYFRDRFGIAPDVGYNVDSFGHTATLPDILAGHGYAAYVFRRPEQHQVALPANAFVWRGPGGGEVVAFRIEPGYVANFADLSGQVPHRRRERRPGARPHHVLLRRRQPRRRPVEGDDRVDPRQPRLRRPRAGLLDARRPSSRRSPTSARLLPRVTTELQHCFPGCYSVMHDIKRAQRHGEQLLVPGRGGGAARSPPTTPSATPASPGSTAPGTTCSSPSSTTS